MTTLVRRPQGEGPERIQQAAARAAGLAASVAGAQTISLSHRPTWGRMTANVANPMDVRVAETAAALADGVPASGPTIPAWHLPASTTEEVLP